MKRPMLTVKDDDGTIDLTFDSIMRRLPDAGPRYYDRQGRPLPENVLTLAMMFGDSDYKIVKQEKVGHGPGAKWVSTVWLGLDHNWNMTGPPLIFETMVFPWTSCGDIYMRRYSTEEQALAGHRETVEIYKYNRKQRRKHGTSVAGRANT